MAEVVAVGAAIFGGAAVKAGVVMTAIAQVGAVTSVVGAVTGNKKLTKIGAVMGVVGGVGSMVAGAMGSPTTVAAMNASSAGSTAAGAAGPGLIGGETGAFDMGGVAGGVAGAGGETGLMGTMGMAEAASSVARALPVTDPTAGISAPQPLDAPITNPTQSIQSAPQVAPGFQGDPNFYQNSNIQTSQSLQGAAQGVNAPVTPTTPSAEMTTGGTSGDSGWLEPGSVKPIAERKNALFGGLEGVETWMKENPNLSKLGMVVGANVIPQLLAGDESDLQERQLKLQEERLRLDEEAMRNRRTTAPLKPRNPGIIGGAYA